MVGVARFEVHAPPKYGEAVRPQPTVMTGYEFLVTAKTGAKPLGATKLLMRPGSVPALRLRVPSAVVEAGASFPVDLLRGPDFTGALPEKLHFAHGPQRVEFKVDADSATALVTVPSDVEGWAAVAGGSAQVFLYVRPKGQLRLRVTATSPATPPGSSPSSASRPASPARALRPRWASSASTRASLSSRRSPEPTSWRACDPR